MCIQSNGRESIKLLGDYDGLCGRRSQLLESWRASTEEITGDGDMGGSGRGSGLPRSTEAQEIPDQHPFPLSSSSNRPCLLVTGIGM